MERTVLYFLISILLITQAVFAFLLFKFRKQKKQPVKDELLGAFSLYDNMGVSVYVVDAQTYEVLYENKKTKESVGDVTGKTCYEGLCHRTKPCSFCVPNAELKTDGSVHVSTNRFNPKLKRYFNVYENLIDWKDGRKARLCASIDVTESIVLAEKSRQIKSMFSIQEAILNSVNMSLYVIDSNNKILFINEVIQEFIGKKQKIGDILPVEDMYPEEELEYFRTELIPSAKKGEVMSGETEMLNKVGKRIPIRYTVFPVRDEDGFIFAYANIGEDISTEVKLRQSEEWRKAIAEYSKEWLASFDKDLRIVFSNKSLNNITGWNENVEGTCYDYLSPASQKVLDEEINPKISRGEVWTGEVELVSKDGEVITSYGDVFPLYDKKNQIMGFGTSLHDTRQQREMDSLISKQLKTQKFITEFSVPFTKPYVFSELIETALGNLLQFMDTDRISLYEMRDKATLVCTYEVRKKPEYESRVGLEIEIEKIKNFFEELLSSSYVYHKSTKEMYEKNPSIDYGAQSVCSIPLIIEGNCLGFLVYVALEEPSDWSEADCNLAKMAGSIVAGALATKNKK